MKIKKYKNIKEAALRLVNDIALVDVDLAVKLQPSIMKFSESVKSENKLSYEDLISLLPEFLELNKSEKEDFLNNNNVFKEWFEKIFNEKPEQTILDEDNEIMDLNTEPVIDDDEKEGGEFKLDDAEEFHVVDDENSTDGENSTDLDDLTGIVPKKGILDKIQINTRVRAYIEKCLAEFINEKVHANVVEENVPGYSANFAADGFDNRLDDAFSKLLDVLVNTLVGNYK